MCPEVEPKVEPKKEVAMESELLTTKQVSELLHVSDATVDNLRKAGKLLAIQIGRQWRFKREDIDHHIKGESTVPLVQKIEAPDIELEKLKREVEIQKSKTELAKLKADEVKQIRDRQSIEQQIKGCKDCQNQIKQNELVANELEHKLAEFEQAKTEVDAILAREAEASKREKVVEKREKAFQKATKFTKNWEEIFNRSECIDQLIYIIEKDLDRCPMNSHREQVKAVKELRTLLGGSI